VGPAPLDGEPAAARNRCRDAPVQKGVVFIRVHLELDGHVSLPMAKGCRSDPNWTFCSAKKRPMIACFQGGSRQRLARNWLRRVTLIVTGQIGLSMTETDYAIDSQRLVAVDRSC